MSAETQGAETRTGEAPQITDHECEQFYRHAEDGATAEHDGVEYALIQPYDLQRFAMTVKALRRERDEARRALEDIAAARDAYRRLAEECRDNAETRRQMREIQAKLDAAHPAETPEGR